MRSDLFLKEDELEDYRLLQALKKKEKGWKKRMQRKIADREAKVNFIANLKIQVGCYSCEENDFIVLDLHHVESKKKAFNFRSCYYFTWEEILNELKKCKVLCSNCHRRGGLK